MARVRTLVRRRAGVLAAAAAAVLGLTGPATAGPATAGASPATASAGPAEAAGPASAVGFANAAGPASAVGPGEASGPAVSVRALPRGHDVSSHQERVDWPEARAGGARFVYVKATESTDYRNPYFSGQYRGAREAGLIRGAYHFARPDRSSGARQAAYFLRHGGGWRADGWTLPPALDIEYNPYSEEHVCYGLDKERMVRWIRSFGDEVERETGRRPVIYTTTEWWRQCTGDGRAFSSHPLWLARHGAARPGALPGGWRDWTFWQYGVKGGLPGDQNLFNGSAARLRAFARGR
ncbi:lysozyme [Streptomyces sp. NPDC013455]|uniref:lysozyme n=1 Tax=Streptomyces sp. NPDC013455 TaxID=3155605 RepID=UPI0033CD0B0B